MEANTDNVLQAVLPLVDVFERLGIRYYIGGSLASSVYGDSRPTQDADLVADIEYKHVNTLVRLLEETYYIDGDMIRDAIRRRSSFNIMFLETMYKIDVFIPKNRPFAKQEFLRVQQKSIEEDVPPLYYSSPEDIILNKLEWFKMGNEIATRQWNDVLGVIKQQGPKLDLAYLRHWASNLGVADLLQRALSVAELQE